MCICTLIFVGGYYLLKLNYVFDPKMDHVYISKKIKNKIK